jgi:uncharacterized damage-inducible protein DinB
MRTLLRDLLAHAEWANAVFFDAWGRSPAREHEEIRRRVGHIIGVQQGFLAVLHGQTPSGPPGGLPQSFDELKARAHKSHDGLCEFGTSLDSGILTNTVVIPWFPDPPCEVTIAEAIVQVAMHSQHHRGQCMTRLKDFGGEPKNVDWIIWLWKQKPPAIWETGMDEG